MVAPVGATMIFAGSDSEGGSGRQSAIGASLHRYRFDPDIGKSIVANKSHHVVITSPVILFFVFTGEAIFIELMEAITSSVYRI